MVEGGGSGPKGNRGQPRRGRHRRPPGPRDRRTAEPGAKRRRVPPAIRIGVDVAADDVVERSSQFRVLEVDAGLEILTDRVVGPWVDRTPEGFVVDVRAHRLFTHHPVPLDSLWPEVRDALSPSLRSRRQVYADDLTARVLDRALDRFFASLEPLREFGKLGAVVFPFPSYFAPSTRASDYLGWLRERAGDIPLAIEVRNRDWVAGKQRDATMSFFEEHRLAYVSVDVPPGCPNSLPPLAVATTDLAVVRFHGRNGDAWERGADTGDDRMAYTYRPPDLEPWVARLTKLASAARAVHVFFTTGSAESASRDARLLVRVLTEEPKPDAPPPPRPPQKRRRRR
jgi:uncharacterized protein YecE (DUF72 family)